MLRELTLALEGITGDCFIESPSARSFVTSPDLSFVGETERRALDRLLLLGYSFRALERFCALQHRRQFTSAAQRSNASASTSASAPAFAEDEGDIARSEGAFSERLRLRKIDSVFVRALAVGLQEVLDGFRKDVLLLEGRALKNDVTPLTLVVASFEKYHVLFPFLEGLVASVCKGGLTGGKLLSFLHSQRLHGVPFVREAVERLFLSVQRAFLRQVTAWALFGVVSDRCGDFFVADSSDAASSSLVLFSAGAAEKRSDSAGGDGGGEEQTTTTERRGREDWLADGFSLRLSMIPSFVSQKSAETILFVGRAARIQTMNQDGKGKGAASLASASPSPFGAMASRLLAAASSPSARWEEVEGLLEELREAANERLFETVVREGGFQKAVRCLRDVCLLFNGQLFSFFLEEASELLLGPPPTKRRQQQLERELNVAFRRALSSCGLDDNAFFHRFYFTLGSSPEAEAAADAVEKKREAQRRAGTAGFEPSKRERGAEEGPLSWEDVNVRVRMSFPLSLILTESVLHRYNEVFNLLFHLKRAQTALDLCWIPLQRGCRYKGLSDGVRGGKEGIDVAEKTDRRREEAERSVWRLWRLRQRMSFFLSALQSYFLGDVVACAFEELEGKWAEEKDFASVASSHSSFLDRVHKGCFLPMKLFSGNIREILAVALRLGTIVRTLPKAVSQGRAAKRMLSRRRGERDESDVDEDELWRQRKEAEASLSAATAERLSNDFRSLSSLLYRNLRALRNHRSFPAPLLLRLDFKGEATADASF